LATKEGMEIQIKEALARKPGATLRSMKWSTIAS
jgi:hypothetical protein